MNNIITQKRYVGKNGADLHEKEFSEYKLETKLSIHKYYVLVSTFISHRGMCE